MIKSFILWTLIFSCVSGQDDIAVREIVVTGGLARETVINVDQYGNLSRITDDGIIYAVGHRDSAINASCRTCMGKVTLSNEGVVEWRYLRKESKVEAKLSDKGDGVEGKANRFELETGGMVILINGKKEAFIPVSGNADGNGNGDMKSDGVYLWIKIK